MKRDTLGVYHSKRDFTVSPEPSGKTAHKTKTHLSYVIQRNPSTNGVLISAFDRRGFPELYDVG